MKLREQCDFKERVMELRSYVATLFQMIVWSGYSLAEWLSSHDHWEFNVAMFLVFVFLAYKIAKSIVKSTRASCTITAMTLAIYFLFHWGIPAMMIGT